MKPTVFPGLHVKRDIDNRPTWQKTNPSAVLLIEESKRRAVEDRVYTSWRLARISSMVFP